jgi:hypothetical protein
VYVCRTVRNLLKQFSCASIGNKTLINCTSVKFSFSQYILHVRVSNPRAHLHEDSSNQYRNGTMYVYIMVHPATSVYHTEVHFVDLHYLACDCITIHGTNNARKKNHLPWNTNNIFQGVSSPLWKWSKIRIFTNVQPYITSYISQFGDTFRLITSYLQAFFFKNRSVKFMTAFRIKKCLKRRPDDYL